jgi:DNA-binding NarL/FixJ family response regulator
MDRHMNCDGAEATRLIARQLPDVRVVVLTGFSHDDPVFAALRAGARGFLTKDAGEVLQAMAARAGEAQLDPSVQRRQAWAMVRGERVSVPGASQAGAAPDGLTQREVEVLTQIAVGLSNAEIVGRFIVMTWPDNHGGTEYGDG